MKTKRMTHDEAFELVHDTPAMEHHFYRRGEDLGNGVWAMTRMNRKTALKFAAALPHVTCGATWADCIPACRVAGLDMRKGTAHV